MMILIFMNKMVTMMMMMRMIRNFQPTHSEKLSLPNAFNVDPLVSNGVSFEVDDDEDGDDVDEDGGGDEDVDGDGDEDGDRVFPHNQSLLMY